jgi:hypothetical protein
MISLNNCELKISRVRILSPESSLYFNFVCDRKFCNRVVLPTLLGPYIINAFPGLIKLLKSKNLLIIKIFGI